MLRTLHFEKKQYKKGFSLIEIILALAIVTIVFIAVFDFVVTAYIKKEEVNTIQKSFSYEYDESYCKMSKNINNIHIEPLYIELNPHISTSTKVTSMHMFEKDKIILTTNSASTTEADVFIFRIATTSNYATLLYKKDIGPGLEDSVLLGKYLYVANTSVNSHAKALYIDLLNIALPISTTTTNSTTAITEISNLKISQLAQSISIPKKLSIYNHNLILGSEKNNAGGELFVLDIDIDGRVRSVLKNIEINGQVNQTLSNYQDIHIANAADPELRTLDKSFTELFTYDAPLTLGNGKSTLNLYPYTVFGRTLGSAELSLLKAGANTEVLHTKRTYGTVDYLQKIHDTTQTKRFLSFTANEDKELQFWHIQDAVYGVTPSLILDASIDTVGRVSVYACDESTLYMSTLYNNQPIITWMQL